MLSEIIAEMQTARTEEQNIALSDRVRFLQLLVMALDRELGGLVDLIEFETRLIAADKLKEQKRIIKAALRRIKSEI